jgi:hypothetical protein
VVNDSLNSALSNSTNKWPNLFVVGAPRCGTTAMCLYLKQHPSIHLSILKEPHYFATDLMVQPHTITDQDEYLGLFTDSPVNAEGSVWYLQSEAAPKNIQAHCPNAQIIIMLRRPWQQIQSLHSLYLRTTNEDQGDLEKAIALCEPRLQGNDIPQTSYFHDGLQYLRNSRYHDNVKRYLDTFGDRVKVILFDDFIKDTPAMMTQTFEFVGVQPCDEIEYDQHQATLKLRNTALRQLRRQPDSVRNKLHRNHVSVHQTKEAAPMSEALKQQLMDYYRQDVAATAALLDRDLMSLWYE